MAVQSNPLSFAFLDKKMKGITALDDVTPAEYKKRQPALSKTFKRYALATVLIEYTLAGMSIALIVIYWNTGFVWTQFLHLPMLIRAMLLSGVELCDRIEVYKILGVNKYYKILRHFTRYPKLAWWLLLGFTSLYLLYWWIPIVHIVHFVKNGLVVTAQFPLYIILDVLFFVEHWIAVHLVYKKGVVENVMRKSPELQYCRRSKKSHRARSIFEV